MDGSERPERVTGEDLIQVKHDWYQLMLYQKRRELRGDWEHRVEQHFGEGSTWINVGENFHPPLDASVELVFGRQLQEHASDVRGANPREPPGWKRVDFGDRVERAADYNMGFFPPNSLLTVPAVIGTWVHDQRRHVRITVRTEDEQAAHDYLAALTESARGPSNPWRFQLLEAKAVGRNVGFEPRSIADLDPGPLWFDDEIVEIFDNNVIDAAGSLAELRNAGLGSNRGILVAGPPGVGKTALCRSAAVKLHGRATIVLVSAQVGQWLISRLYEELQYLAPAVVFLEDLDLLVGDRDDRSARQGLMDFLTVLDGLMTRHHEVVTVATSNDPSAIDVAAQRAGRFDLVLEVAPPSRATRSKILGHFVDQLANAADIDVERLAAATEGFTGADLRETIRRAVLAHPDASLAMEHLVVAVESQRNAKGTTGGDGGRYL